MERNTTQKDRARKGTKNAFNSMVYGKVPPQAKDLEEAVLGTLLTGLYPDLFDEVYQILKTGSFYLEAHNRIFSAVERLGVRGYPITVLSVFEELKRTEDAGLVVESYELTKLTNKNDTPNRVLHYCRIIFQKHLAREIIRISGEAIGDAYEDKTDVFELMNRVEGMFCQLMIQGTLKPYVSIGEAAAKSVKKIYEMKVSEDPNKWLTGVPTGWLLLDKVTQGLQPTNFIVLAARPGIGKSAVGANLARNAATHEIKPTAVGIFSLEMSTEQWVNRIIAAETHIDRLRMKRGDLTDSEMKALQEVGMIRFEKLPIYFDDSPRLTMFELRSKARRMVTHDKVGLIIVDYIQLLSSGTNEENRNAEVSKISRDLKQLAKELKIPVVALSQLTRAGDGPTPKMKDLRESGAIEQDADEIFFITTPSEEEIRQSPDLKDTVMIKGAKHRDGVLIDIPLKFVKDIQKLFTFEQYEQYQITRGLQKEKDGRWKKAPAHQEDLFNDKTTAKK